LVYTQGQVICRPTQKEADDYYHWANVENAEWRAIDHMLELRNVTPSCSMSSRMRQLPVSASRSPRTGAAVTSRANAERPAGLAARHAVPALYDRRRFTDAGRLMSYGS
jgi:hypothetical protein